MNAIEAKSLGKRYGSQDALIDCSLRLPAGRAVALVGPNGAGKTTLLSLVAGLSRPTSGSVEVFGLSPLAEPSQVLPRIGFLAQDRPLYQSFRVEEMLEFGRRMNSQWDGDFARKRLDGLGIPLSKKVGKLSGGQKAQVALVLALAKNPDVLLLDEPVAALDPLARREFQSALMEIAADHNVTILLSSHIIADLERVCDYLVILSHGRVQVSGEIDHLVAKHKYLTGLKVEEDAVGRVHNVVYATRTPRQTTLLVRTNGAIFSSEWQISEPTLEEIVLAYLGQEISAESSYVQEAEEVPA